MSNMKDCDYSKELISLAKTRAAEKEGEHRWEDPNMPLVKNWKTEYLVSPTNWSLCDATNLEVLSL